MVIRRRFAAAALLSAVAWPARRALAAGSDARVRARLAYNLARFTQWPAVAAAADGGEFLFTTLGAAQPPLENAFAEFNGQAVGAKTWRFLSPNTSAISRAHLVYFDQTAARVEQAALTQLGARPVLTIGDSDDFLLRGMVQIVNVDDALRFDVNLTLVRAAQLNISSQVLKLARRVVE
jgi:hypothetical protein